MDHAANVSRVAEAMVHKHENPIAKMLDVQHILDAVVCRGVACVGKYHVLVLLIPKHPRICPDDILSPCCIASERVFRCTASVLLEDVRAAAVADALTRFYAEFARRDPWGHRHAYVNASEQPLPARDRHHASFPSRFCPARCRRPRPRRRWSA